MYIVENIILSDHHPQWPLLPCFKIRRPDSEFEFAIYLSKEEADKYCEKLNSKVIK